jgi:hypothetical protein
MNDGSEIQYPRGLPNDRGNRAQTMIIVFIAVLLIGKIYLYCGKFSISPFAFNTHRNTGSLHFYSCASE